MLNNLIQMVMSGSMQNSPLMKQFNQYFGGKSTPQQMQTLINMAQNKGFDINQKIFSADDLRKLGIKLP